MLQSCHKSYPVSCSTSVTMFGSERQVMLRFKIGVLHKASQWKKGLLPPSINCLQLMVRRRGLCLEAVHGTINLPAPSAPT